MPDASKTTVDGVEPSILVKFTSNANPEDTTNSITLFTNDEGAPRSLKRGEEEYVTPKELALITGGHNVEVITPETTTSTPVVSTPVVAQATPVRSANPSISPIQGS